MSVSALGSCAGRGAGGPAVQGSGPSSPPGEACGVVLQEKVAGCPAPLERGPGGSMAAWEQGSPRAPGPISPRARSYSTSSLIPPDSAMRSGSLRPPLVPSCPRALAHSSLHAAGAGEGRPHTALGAVPWGSGAPGSLSPAPGAGFVPQCWGCCSCSFPNVSEILLVATASVPAEVEQERLQMGVIQDLHQASESCRAGDLG